MEYAPAAAKILLCAAHDGDLEQLKKFAAVLDHLIGDGIPATVKYLIEDMKVEIDVKDGAGQTPLSHAFAEGRLAAVEYLLEMGANPEILDDSNTSPLHYVTMSGHKHFIPLLLSKGINVDVINNFGSPLQYAATAGDHDAVKVLMDHGANPNLVFHDTFSPLLASIGSLSWRCMEQLLKAGADPNGGPEGIKALPLAAQVGEAQIIKLLVEAGADPKLQIYTD